MERNAKGRVVAALAAAGLLVGGAGQASAGNPVTPLVADETGFIGFAEPWISPTGEQLFTYLRQDPGGPLTTGLKARTGGAPFGGFEQLSAVSGTGLPNLAFAPDGTALIAWEAGGSGPASEQTVRPPLGPPETAGPAGSCIGPVALAISPGGRTASGCRTDTGLVPPWTGQAGVGQAPARIAPTLPITPSTGSPDITPFAAWGSDGTGVVGFGYEYEGPPPEQRIEARVFGANSSFAETVQVGSASEPATLLPTGAAVLPNGIVGITADSDQGAVLFTRPAGPGTSFTRTEMIEDTASMPAADQWGRLHFLTSITGGPTGTTWWVRVREPDGSLREAIPIPTEGSGAVPVENGLQVFPNGAEAIVTRSDTGFYIAFRRPGAGAFSIPRRLAGTSGTSGGAVSRSAQGDILLAWAREVTPGRRQLMVGGWDSGTLPAITRLTMPKQMRRGATGRFSVSATDAMGIGRITWQFPGNRRLEGPSVRARLTKPGTNRVKVTVFDQAGFRSIRIRRVKVVIPGGPRVQGLAGTSGSPRP